MKYDMFNGILHKGNKQSEEKTKKKKIIKIIIILFCITIIASLVILYIKNDKCREIFDKYIFRKEIHAEDLPEIRLDSLKQNNIYAYGNYIVVLDQNELKIYNKYGHEEHTINVDISNPIFEEKGNYLCVAEKNGQMIYLISDKNIKWQKEIEGKISSVNMNSNGYVSVTISGASYKSVVEIYDSDGNELFKIYRDTTNVIDTDISNDNKYLALAEVNFSGILVQSNIEIISIEEAQKNSLEPIKNTYTADADNLIINIEYNNKNELVCMYDKHIDILKNGENSELVNFDNENILYADINLSSKFVKVTKQANGLFNSKIEMQIINNSNTENVILYEIENIPKQLYIYGDRIAINLGTDALFIDGNGWLIKKYQSNEEIQKIVLSNSIAGVVCKNKIKVVSL